jgi:hypothetical protein
MPVCCRLSFGWQQLCFGSLPHLHTCSGSWTALRDMDSFLPQHGWLPNLFWYQPCYCDVDDV